MLYLKTIARVVEIQDLNKVPVRIVFATVAQAVGLLFGDAATSLFITLTVTSNRELSFGYIYATASATAAVLLAIMYTLFCVEETHKFG